MMTALSSLIACPGVSRCVHSLVKEHSHALAQSQNPPSKRTSVLPTCCSALLSRSNLPSSSVLPLFWHHIMSYISTPSISHAGEVPAPGVVLRLVASALVSVAKFAERPALM